MRARRLARWLAAAAIAFPVWAMAGDAARGKAIYDGLVPLTLATSTAAPAQACVACHRPSGLGNFEGRLAVPPIAGPQLFREFDRDTARYFRPSGANRVRPAYDEASLARLLRTGLTPDGLTIHAAMPRVRIDDAAVADLAAHLRGLSASPPPGLDRDDVYLATVSTPDADPVRRDAMLATLQRFIELKNGQSRHEAMRSRQAGHTREMLMYTKFRVWHLAHWALEGDPSEWPAQLARRQAERPVFAMVGGIGETEWGPVEAFCESERMPCLLPLIDAPADGRGTGFYNLHFHAGIDADARLAAQTLREHGHLRAVLWPRDEAPALTQRVTEALARSGVTMIDTPAGDAMPAGAAVVSLLAPEAMTRRLARHPSDAAPVMWLAGSHALGSEELAGVLRSAWNGWIVTPMRTGVELDRQMLRTRQWLSQQGLGGVPVDVAGSALQAATVLGEGLMHMDFGFTREYLLELLEHGLENVIPWSPYPRLSIGPGQRIAVKQSQLGVVDAGRVDWRAEPLR